jgi:uncharacterized membrane protein (UPF0127 family)
MTPRTASILALVIAAGACAAPTSPAPAAPPLRSGPDPGPSDARPALVIGGHELRVDVAATPVAREQGLQGRRELADSEGLVFLFPATSFRSFWMKGCLIDLDLAFVDESGRILELHGLAAPAPGTPDRFLPRIVSAVPVRGALEVRRGWFGQRGLGPGARIEGWAELLAATEVR